MEPSRTVAKLPRGRVAGPGAGHRDSCRAAQLAARRRRANAATRRASSVFRRACRRLWAQLYNQERLRNGVRNGLFPGDRRGSISLAQAWRVGLPRQEDER